MLAVSVSFASDADEMQLNGEGNSNFTQLQIDVDKSSDVCDLNDDYVCEDGFGASGVNITMDMTVDGHDSSINALNKSVIFNVSANGVSFKSIKFIDSQNAVISDGASIIFEDCKFVNAGVNFTGVNLTFKNCEFTFNSFINANCENVNVSGSAFHDMRISDNAIALNASNMVFDDNVFENNIAYNLTGDTLYTGGFACLINITRGDVTFSKNRFKANALGYLIYSQNQTNAFVDEFTVENSDFSAYKITSNIKKDISGYGMIFTGNFTNLEMTNIKFRDIKGSRISSLISVNVTGNFSVINGEFLNLSCPYGFIEIYDNYTNPAVGKVTFDRCSFKNINTDYNMTCYDWDGVKGEYIWRYGHGLGSGIRINYDSSYSYWAYYAGYDPYRGYDYRYFINKDLSFTNINMENVEGGGYYIDFTSRNLDVVNFTITDSKIGRFEDYGYGYYSSGLVFNGLSGGNVTLKDILQDNIVNNDYNCTGYNSTFDKYLCLNYVLDIGGAGFKIGAKGSMDIADINITNCVGSDEGVLVLQSGGNLTADRILVENLTGGETAGLDKYYQDLDLQTFKYYGRYNAGLGLISSERDIAVSNILVKNSTVSGPYVQYGTESNSLAVIGAVVSAENITFSDVNSQLWGNMIEISGDNTTAKHISANNAVSHSIKNESSYDEALGRYIWKYSESVASPVIRIYGSDWADVTDIAMTNCQMGADDLFYVSGGVLNIDSVNLENISSARHMEIKYDYGLGQYLYECENYSGGYEGVLTLYPNTCLNISNIVISNAVLTDLGNAAYIYNSASSPDSYINIVNLTVSNLYPLNNNRTSYNKQLGRYISTTACTCEEDVFMIGCEGTINITNLNAENINEVASIFSLTANSVNIENSTFRNMSSYKFGTELDENTGQVVLGEFNNLGCLMHIQSDYVVISNSTFRDMNFSNEMQFGESGVIYCEARSTPVFLDFINSTFTNCTVVKGFRGQYNSQTGGYDIQWSNYEDGATLMARDYWNVYLEFMDFENCSAIRGGAFAYLNQYYNDLYIINSTFTSNTAELGGAVYLSASGADVINCSFVNNTAENGGALYIDGYSDDVKSSNFFNNTAHFGGAIYYANGANTLSLSQLKYNRAETGSAIYAIYEVYVDSCVILQNQAKSSSLVTSFNITDDNIEVTAVFEGNDNLINGIYATSDCHLSNVTYWTCMGETNSNDANPQKTILEDGINITLELYDSTFMPIKVTNCTDVNGQTRLALSGLKNNRYFVVIKHDEDLYYTSIKDADIIQIGLLDSPIDLKADDIFYMENATIEVSLPIGTTGNVTFEIDGANFTTVNLTDSFASAVRSGLAGGIHNLTVYYSGDATYLENRTSKTFTVKPISSFIIVKTDGGDYKADIQVNVTVTPNATGNVILVIENVFGETLTINDTNNLQTVINALNAGKYNITAYYEGDKNYSASSNATNFTVNPIDLNPIVRASNVTEDENSTFTIIVPDDFLGKVNITVGDVSRVYDIEGSTELTFVNLPAGEKSANVTFSGDSNYNITSLYPVSFNVTEKINPVEGAVMNVTIKDITYFDNATAIVNISDKLNGSVIIMVDGNPFEGRAVNGTASVNLYGLSGGVKIAYANFTSTDKQVNLTAVTKFVVNQLPSEINVTVSQRNVTVSVVKGSWANLTVYVNGVKIDEFKYEGHDIVLGDVLIAGNNTILAIYSGNENYTSSQKDTWEMIAKMNSTVNATADEAVYGSDAEVVVHVGEGQSGYVTVYVNNRNYTSQIKGTQIVFTVSGLDAGKYPITAVYSGDANYTNNANTTELVVSEADLNATVIAQNITVLENSAFIVSVPDDFTGYVNITVEGKSYSGDVKPLLSVGNLTLGEKTANVILWNDSNYKDLALNVTFNVGPAEYSVNITTIKSDNMTRGYNSEFDYEAAFLDKDGNALANAEVQFTVNSKTYYVKTNDDGIAKLTDAKLAVGTYNITSLNPVAGESVTNTVKIVKRITENKDLVMDYRDGSVFKVKVWGEDGNPAKPGEIIDITANGVHYVAQVDKNGYAGVKINLVPKTYKVIAQYKGFKTTNKVTVKQVLKAVKKTTKAKKGKKLVLKAKLVWSNGKPIQGKVLKFKFSGKTYKGKTGKNGIAKVTIKKKVTKKLKKGKKYTVKVSYDVREKYGDGYITISDKIKMYVKVKK